jgi:hypothetical protein
MAAIPDTPTRPVGDEGDKAHQSRNAAHGGSIAGRRAFEFRLPTVERQAIERDPLGLALALNVGPTSYPLLEPREIRCRKVAGGFEFTLVGHGRVSHAPTERKAELCWVWETHADIQKLRRKKASGLLPEEAMHWSELSSLIDLERFERRQLITLRQAARVLEPVDGGLAVRWIGYDEEPEVVPFELAPAELAAFEVGERFDATVLREPVSWRLVEVLDSTLLPPLTEERRRELLEELSRSPSTQDTCDKVD